MNTPTLASDWEFHLGESPSKVLAPINLLHRPENRFLTPLVQPGQQILEAGSGNGRFVFAFAAAKAYAVGVDFSQRLTEKVQAEAKAMGLENAVAIFGDILNLPLESDRFHLYTSFGVYEHFTSEQHKRLFAEAYRVIRPGGTIYIEVPHFWSLWTVRREIRYWFRRLFPPGIVWQRNMRRGYLQRCAQEAGFQTMETHVFDAWYGLQKGLSLEDRTLKHVPNPFYPLRPALGHLAHFCDRKEWLGHNLVYIGRKPLQ